MLLASGVSCRLGVRGVLCVLEVFMIRAAIKRKVELPDRGLHAGICTGQAGSQQISLNIEFLARVSHCGSVTGGRESVRRLRSVRHPRPAHFFCTTREVDAQVGSRFTIDPYRRESASVSRLCHVHPEQGVDLECVLFRTGCTSPRVVQCFLPGSRPLRAALMRAAFFVPGLETDRVVAMWHPPFHRCCMAILC